MVKHRVLWIALALAVVGALLLGCGGAQEDAGETPDSGQESVAGPAKDPNQPFALDEEGTVSLVNDQAYDIRVQRETGDPLFVMSMKKSAVIDPQVDFTIQSFEDAIPEELAASYVAIGTYLFEMHAVAETGYGFALRPKLQFFYSDQEIATAKEGGGATDDLKGNLVVLYKEQRSPKWVPQMSLSVDQEAKTVTVSNIAGAGAWRLVVKK